LIVWPEETGVNAAEAIRLGQYTENCGKGKSLVYSEQELCLQLKEPEGY
jgi:hypothetical protein